MTRPAVALALGAVLCSTGLSTVLAPLPAARAQSLLSDWRSIGPDGASILALAAHADAPENLVAGGLGALFFSTDGGQSWVRGGSGLFVPDTGALHVAQDGTVYAGTYGNGVYLSIDGGATFTPANAGLDSAVVFAIAGDAAGAIWAGGSIGVVVSTDGGQHWEDRSIGIPNEVHDLLPVGADSVYAATLSGVFLSTDDGLSWNPRNQGLSNLKAVSLARRPDGGFLYVGTTTTVQEESGVYRSSDGGSSWTLMSAGLTNRRVADLLIDPAESDVILAATQTLSLFTQSGVFRSTDAGENWNLVPGNPESRDVRVLAAIAGDIFAGAVSGTTLRGGVFRSPDGQTFTRSDEGIIVMQCRTVASFSGLADEVLVGAQGTFREPGGAYRSPDGGLTWTDYSGGGLNAKVNVLRIATTHLRYAGTANGVWRRSGTSGDAWEATVLASGPVHDLALSPAMDDSLDLYAATSMGVFYSANGGTSFSLRSSGLTRLEVRALAIDPDNGFLIFAGTDSAGVFGSLDGGDQWESVNEGLGNLDVRDLEFDGITSVFAATAGGVFELNLNVLPESRAGRTAVWTWEARNDGLGDLDVRSLAIHGSRRFAATAGGVFEQVGDPTGPWAAWSSGLPSLDVRAIYADVAVGRFRVFACTDSNGLYLADEPLPVLLARLDVHALPGRVEVTFPPARPQDVLGFEVERRLQGENDFTPRSGPALVEGPDYRFVDEDPRLVAGTVVWYRLIAVAMNGGREALLPFPVAIPAEPLGAPPPALPRLRVFPNPFEDEAHIAVTGGGGGVIHIRDVGGRNVYRLAVGGEGLLTWDGKGESGEALASGIYMIALETPTGTAVTRVVKVR